MEQYRAPGWLIGGNSQTIWPALLARRFDASLTPPPYRRERWDTPDGDFIDVDWQEPDAADAPVVGRSAAEAPVALAPAATAPADDAPAESRAADDAPLLVLFHGLEGSSSSHYALAFAHWARRHGWRYAVPHFRGCSGELNRAPRAYHSGDFEEVGWVLGELRRRHPRGRIVAVGVSLGGNALLRWAAEAGAAAGRSVAAVCAISAPVDLAAGGRAIGRGVVNRQVYTRMFLRTMKPKALRMWSLHPGLFDRQRLAAARDLHAFDDVFTAPLHGFRDADDYWRRASAKPHLHRITVPTLVLNARNDPFIPAGCLPGAGDVSASVTLWQPAHGGHVGFPAGRSPGQRASLPEQVMSWAAAHT